MSLTMSFMKIRNKRGSKREPCGTPAEIETGLDKVPGRTTCCCLSDI